METCLKRRCRCNFHGGGAARRAPAVIPVLKAPTFGENGNPWFDKLTLTYYVTLSLSKGEFLFLQE